MHNYNYHKTYSESKGKHFLSLQIINGYMFYFAELPIEDRDEELVKLVLQEMIGRLVVREWIAK